ncbi:MAG TPA: hypothetical protein VGA60_07905 [Kiloniellales bacterium]
MDNLEEWFPNCIIPQQIEDIFDLDCLPEPYLRFGAPGERIAFLTLNPGGCEEFQRRNNILSGVTIGPFEAYAQAAQQMADGYETGRRLPINAKARGRITKMRELAEAYGQRDFFQFELFPFHSANLSNELVAGCETALDQYLRTLTQHLQCFRTVWAISGAPRDGFESPKIRAFAKVLGMRLDQCQMRVLRRDGTGKPTVYLHYETGDDRSRVISCMRGSNQLPANPPVI